MQHLLFPDRLTAAAPSTTKAFPTPSSHLAAALDELPHDLRALYDAVPDDPALAADDTATGLRLHRLLTVLDPDIAARWHWKDSRKVLRSLVIIKENGRKNSEIIAEQSITSVRPRCVGSIWTCEESDEEMYQI
jgi:tRNA dimethylallyltransferase